jgi:hypothetical protein
VIRAGSGAGFDEYLVAGRAQLRDCFRDQRDAVLGRRGFFYYGYLHGGDLNLAGLRTLGGPA